MRTGFLFVAVSIVSFFTWVPVETLYFSKHLVFLLLSAVFFLIYFRHQNIRETKEIFQLRLELEKKFNAIARCQWPVRDSSARSLNPNHLHVTPYDQDLQLSGPYSLLELMPQAITQLGDELLKKRLDSNFIESIEIIRRQNLRKELEAKRVFRRKILLRSMKYSNKVDSHQILKLAQKKFLEPGWGISFGIIAVLYLILDLLFFLFFFFGTPPYFLFVLFILLPALSMAAKALKIKEAYSESLGLAVSLEKFAAVTSPLLKIYRFQKNKTPHSELLELLRPFYLEIQFSKTLRQLERIVSALSIKQNPVARILCNSFFPWDFFWTLRLDFLLRHLSAHLPLWFHAFAEVEVSILLCELGLHWGPGNCEPELISYSTNTQGGDFPLLKADGLGHPLLPHASRIVNSITLDKDHRLLITGSNMSGKSSFLKAVGINLILAKAGARVCAKKFQFTNMNLFTSISRTDSLITGISTFMAEAKALSQLFQAATNLTEPILHLPLLYLPILYLIDEIYRGTNHRERILAGQAFLKAICQFSHATGIVTTHDQEFVGLSEFIPSLRNYHFEDSFEAGFDGNQKKFRYRLLEGPNPSTNALKILESFGLPIS